LRESFKKRAKKQKRRLFRFEKWSLEQPDFKHLVEKVWNTSCAFDSAIDIWQFKIRLLRKKCNGWARNINADIKKRKLTSLRSLTFWTTSMNWGSCYQERNRGWILLFVTWKKFGA
jgi:hypothetical protein